MMNDKGEEVEEQIFAHQGVLRMKKWSMKCD
jgi:hypothetical protein